MRLHTDIITLDHVYAALSAEKDAGRIARSVDFKLMNEHKSRSRARSFEIQLDSWDRKPGDGRRRGNAGSYGAGEDWAATYDEWGWLMAALYRIDPLAIWGTAKNPQYASALDFHDKTGMTYALQELLVELESGRDPYPYVTPNPRRLGRQGSCRRGEQVTAWGRAYLTWDPRTPEWYASFALISRDPLLV